MNTQAIFALKERRAKAAGRIESLQKQLSKSRREVASLDATIHIFDPAYKVGSIRPKRPKVKTNLFKMGQLGRIILDALRKAERPLSSAEVVEAVALAAGAEKAREPLFRPSVSANLSYMARRGKVIKAGSRDRALWALNPL
ncbi:hypothetical protein [Aestuariivirga litoralis]|uniref:hypothetical protein n=1 Tax=Aestuariivirga litoralis TaxID=2650924 RepID=UPI0018C822BB|nr:hypothetical protein [Aestuariivirga litoralis]MBG1233996.1 hypothetical protein [Aestuariivirga litoralis]